jgi:hypothetical protein
MDPGGEGHAIANLRSAQHDFTLGILRVAAVRRAEKRSVGGFGAPPPILNPRRVNELEQRVQAHGRRSVSSPGMRASGQLSERKGEAGRPSALNRVASGLFAQA